MKDFIEKLKKKIKPELIKPAASCLLVFCLLVTSSFVLLRNSSLGWFGSNDTVSAENMATSIRGTKIDVAYYYKLSADGEYEEITSFAHLFSRMVPGDKVYVKVVYTNNDDRSFRLSPYLDYESGYEEPLVKEGQYYYLSSQLKLNGETFLLTPSDNEIYFTEEQTPTDIPIGSVDVSAGQEGEIEFYVEFVNLNKSQDDYQHFSSPCNRVIHSDYTVIN